MECGSRCGGALEEMHRYDWLKYRIVLFFKSGELILTPSDL